MKDHHLEGDGKQDQIFLLHSYEGGCKDTAKGCCGYNGNGNPRKEIPIKMHGYNGRHISADTKKGGVGHGCHTPVTQN